ncbi:MAG: biotin transporter BioY [Ruminococcus sp.]|nr:biotin transporter BioY [Ruminococcus sp.]
MAKSRTVKITYCGLFTAVLAVCAWISIPSAVPFTLQTFGIFMAYFTLGNKYGLATYTAYLLLGIMGVPVFSGFRGGVAVVFSQTGGFLAGFLLGGIVVTVVELLIPELKNKKLVSGITLLLVGYTTAVLWYGVFYTKGQSFSEIIHICVTPFVIFDLIKLFVAISVSKRVKLIDLKD